MQFGPIWGPIAPILPNFTTLKTHLAVDFLNLTTEKLNLTNEAEILILEPDFSENSPEKHI